MNKMNKIIPSSVVNTDNTLPAYFRPWANDGRYAYSKKPRQAGQETTEEIGTKYTQPWDYMGSWSVYF